jgi:hypothetical protein
MNMSVPLDEILNVVCPSLLNSCGNNYTQDCKNDIESYLTNWTIAAKWNTTLVTSCSFA